MAAKKKTAKKKVSKKKAKKKKINKKQVLPKTRSKIAASVENQTENVIWTNGTGKKENGRTPACIDLDKVKELAMIGCTQKEICAVLRVSKPTFILMKKNNPILMETILAGREEGNASLRKKQLQVAMQGNPQMLVWLGKNKLNQSDKSIQHIELSQGETFKQALLGDGDDNESNDSFEDL